MSVGLAHEESETRRKPFFSCRKLLSVACGCKILCPLKILVCRWNFRRSGHGSSLDGRSTITVWCPGLLIAKHVLAFTRTIAPPQTLAREERHNKNMQVFWTNSSSPPTGVLKFPTVMFAFFPFAKHHIDHQVWQKVCHHRLPMRLVFCV